jgi:hypothetical protein
MGEYQKWCLWYRHGLVTCEEFYAEFRQLPPDAGWTLAQLRIEFPTWGIEPEIIG